VTRPGAMAPATVGAAARAGCQDGCIACAFFAFDREETASRVYSVRRHRRAVMLELAVGWAR
jgi:hypothetical protein